MILHLGSMGWIQLDTSYHLGSAGLICLDSLMSSEGWLWVVWFVWPHLGQPGWWGPLPWSFILSKLVRAWSHGSYCLPNREGRCIQSLWKETSGTCTALLLPLLLPETSHKARPHSRCTEADSLFREELRSHIIRSFMQGREALVAIFAICCKS